MGRRRQARAPGSPTSRGLTALAVLGAYLGVVATLPSALTWPTAATVASVMIVPAALGGSAFAWAAWRLTVTSSTDRSGPASAIVRLPLGVGRLAAAVLLWGASAGLAATDLTVHPGWALPTIVAGLAAATVVTGIGVDLLLLATREERETVLDLERQLSTLRDQTRADVEHLHEVKGTIAGLASASALISGERRLSALDRERLTQMLTAETARLHRMFAHDVAGDGPALAELGEIIRPLVVAHRVQGQDVVWHPPATRLVAPVDPLAEVVNILLHNASEHAAGAPVSIVARASEGRIRIVVSDLGPGIAEDQRRQVFGWGWRRPGSQGRGVGLAIAAEAMASIDGSLRLDPCQRGGATFVIDLPDRGGDRRAAPRDRSPGQALDSR